MTREDNAAKNHEDKEFMKIIFKDAARTIATHGKDIQKEVKTIIRSCHTTDNKALLLAKADRLKKLAKLYISTSRLLNGAAVKLEDCSLTEDALADVLVSCIFHAHQLKSEEKEAHNILNKLKGKLCG